MERDWPKANRMALASGKGHWGGCAEPMSVLHETGKLELLEIFVLGEHCHRIRLCIKELH